ncbi:GH24 family phage-related lysozyme (muramidase) [Brevundimonas nasdae]|uniref:lysozyme n=1 Tax=Brevundimonas nasdae TaxID=172043 RepID=UPI001912E48F|nr:lysozyme [Brevundimonas nasdae]MBK6026038.1 lysozyme [Brevundimonas nasdae]MDQ0452515.1 GH24 family phage-related lysozyme (muramidase) [Brevundimonas nasdae]
MTDIKSASTPAWAKVTARVALELIEHEAIVLEAYKDSVDVWTWGVGVTNASGHQVHPRYLDKPSTLERALEIFVWLLTEKYVPAVVAAFKGEVLTEAQFAAALSFHYNTGAIGRAEWVKSWKAGKVATARTEIMNWRNPPEIIGRRTAERDLFFSGKWSAKGSAKVYPVRKPSYQPDFRNVRMVDVRKALDAVIA